jgi:hypothetical protein
MPSMQPLPTDPALSERSERVAEIVLRRGPNVRHTLAGLLRRRTAIGGDPLLKPGSAALAVYQVS